jgi:hypothetical protein
VLDEAAIAPVRDAVIAKLRRPWLRATWACAAVTVGVTTWVAVRGVALWWLGVPVFVFVLCCFYLAWAYHGRRPIPGVEDMRSDLESRGGDRPSRAVSSLVLRLGMVAVVAVVWPTSAGSVIWLWAMFASVLGIWVRLTWGRAWFGERYLDLLVVKYILSHPQDPLVGGLMTSAEGAAAIPGLNILPED